MKKMDKLLMKLSKKLKNCSNKHCLKEKEKYLSKIVKIMIKK